MKLSDKEWRVLNALWVAPEGLALGAVVDALRPDTGWSRSTVLTYLTRMEAKGLVDIRKEDFPHRYRAAVSREDAIHSRSIARILCGFSNCICIICRKAIDYSLVSISKYKFLRHSICKSKRSCMRFTLFIGHHHVVLFHSILIII